MAGLVPAIHVFSPIKVKRRGCPGQAWSSPGMTEKSGTRPPRHCEPPGRRKAPPDDRLREAIHLPALETMDGLLRRCAPRNDVRESQPQIRLAHVGIVLDVA